MAPINAVSPRHPINPARSSHRSPLPSCRWPPRLDRCGSTCIRVTSVTPASSVQPDRASRRSSASSQPSSGVPAGQVFAVDKGRSIAADACRWRQALRHRRRGRSLAFCPLGTMRTNADQAWAAEWISTLVELQNITLTPALRNEIQRALTVTRQSRAAKTVSDFQTTLQSKVLREAIEPYTVEGPFGALLDSGADTLASTPSRRSRSRNSWPWATGLSCPSSSTCSVGGRRAGGPASLFLIDEAWIALGHATYRDEIRAWLKVLRRRIAPWSWPRSPPQRCPWVQGSSTSSRKESCPTKIFLPRTSRRTAEASIRSAALRPEQRRMTSSGERHAGPRCCRSSGGGAGACSTYVRPVKLSFLGVSGKDDLRRIRECAARYGADWPARGSTRRGL